MGLIPGAGLVSLSPPDRFYNLPFLLAYSVLDEVLTQFVAQHIFQCNSWMLGKKMEASRNEVPWKNFDLINSGKNDRNSLAHGAVLLDKINCTKYIDAIEAELKAWDII